MRARWTRVALDQGDARPPPRASHTATLVGDGLVVIGGGSTAPAGGATAPAGGAAEWTHFGDAWRFCLRTATWAELEVRGELEPRRGHTAVLLRGCVYIYGGVDHDEVYHEGAAALKCLAFDGAKGLDVLPLDARGPGPRGRRAHVAAAVGDSALLVYGGHVTADALIDAANVTRTVTAAIHDASTVHVFDVDALTWSVADTKYDWLGGGLEPRGHIALMVRAARGVALASAAAAQGALWLTGGVSAALGVAGGASALRVDADDAAPGARRFSARWTKLHSCDGGWAPRYAAACASVDDRFVVVFGGTSIFQSDDTQDQAYLDDVRVLDAAATAATPAVQRPTRRRGNGDVAQEWVSAAWLDVQTDGAAPSKRNAASATAVRTAAGDDAVLVFGGGEHGRAYFSDVSVLRLFDAPAPPQRRRAALQTLQQRCEAAVAREITTDNVAELLAISHARGAADLERACLRTVQATWGLFREAPGEEGAAQTDASPGSDDGAARRARAAALHGGSPTLRPLVERALYGI
ncbi:hypothetical protein M885DRAFT_311928 [Pelagophyceae sp. CCMP2097]|nr:hypothetical protein M885DRAFT_311928 [Pelagophyceae sp. CCMP2097]